MNFTKTPLTFANQISLLKSRGLTIENEDKANYLLNNISYYRLSAYLYSFQHYNDPNHNYMPWATFERVVNLYLFDRDLRILLLDAIERIEVALRCRIVYEYCHAHGNNWYEDAGLFVRNHAKFLSKVDHEIGNSKEAFILHYYSKYNHPARPPAWMAMEVLSFGQLSTMFKILKKDNAKKAVANYFGISTAVLESWMEHLTYVRNLCAHHSRVWNRTMTITAVTPHLPGYKWINILPIRNDKVYTTACIISYLLNRVARRPVFYGALKVLLRRYHSIDLKAAGFPENWENDNFWKTTPVIMTHKARVMYFICRNIIVQHRHRI